MSALDAQAACDRQADAFASATGFAGRRAAAMCGVLLLVFAALWPTTLSLAARWADSVARSYTHGSIILLLAAYMMWRRRAWLAVTPVRLSTTGFGVLVATCLVWMIAWRSGLQIVHQALLPLIALAAVWTIGGLALVRRAWFPIVFLYLAIPVWDVFLSSLQWLSVYAVRGMLGLAGIPVYFDGLEFQIPSGRFEIAGGCAGLHFFIVGIALGTFYGDLHDDTLRSRVRLILLAVLFALATNWIRITIIILAGHFTNMRHYLVSGEHYSFGWGLFAVAMFVYFAIVRRWLAPAAQPTPAPLDTATRVLPSAGVALALLVLTPVALLPRLDRNQAPMEAANRWLTPDHVPGWTRVDAQQIAAPLFVGVDVQRQQRFVAAGVDIHVYDGVYLRQEQGHELSAFDNRPLGERFARSSRTRVLAGDWLENEARSRGEQWLAWSRFRLGSRTFTDLNRLQLTYGVQSMWTAPVSSVTLLRTRCAPDCAAAREALERFERDARLGSPPAIGEEN